MTPAKIRVNGYTGLVSPTSVLVFSSEPATELANELATELAGLGAQALVVAAPAVVPPPDPRAWARSVSELALFNWLVLPTAAAAEALIEAIGAPPGPMLRIAAVNAASLVLRAEGRVPEVDAASLGELLQLLSGRIGRRQRALVPHAAVAGQRIGEWLDDLGAETVCRAAYDFELSAVASFVEKPHAAILGSPGEAEILASFIGADLLPATLPIAALDRAAADAAEDCGLSAVLVAGFPVAGSLGPFLGETLS